MTKISFRGRWRRSGILDTAGLQEMGRRQFLQSLLHIGASGAALSGISKEALANHTGDSREEIPRIVRWRHTNHGRVESGESPPEREPVYESMPRDDFIQLHAALLNPRRAVGL